jgi:hypothetical protein
MARSDLLISLVNASVGGDNAAVRTAVESIIADEKGKQHRVLADRLSRALQANANGSRSLNRTAHDAGNRGREFLEELTPKRQLADLFLAEQTRETVDQLIDTL